jgi:hypothetical protein
MASRPFPDDTAMPPTGSAPGLVEAAGVAAALASERVELWVPGALASLPFAGWIPFVLAVVTLPSVGDLGFFGSSLGISPNFPWNVVVLALAVVMTMVAASIVVAAGETALQRGIERLMGTRPGPRSFDEECARHWTIQLAAALPALVVSAVTLLVVAGVAQTEYQSPDIGGSFVYRVARDVWPLLVALVVCVLLGQAFAGSAQRALRSPADRSLKSALAFGFRELRRHPLRLALLTVLSDLALVAWLAASWALLHLLWAPIGRAVGRGALLESGNALLLVGFVAIWLCLVIAGGALQAWTSTWWTLEIDRDAASDGGG